MIDYFKNYNPLFRKMGQEDIEVKSHINHSKVKLKYLKLIFENKSKAAIIEFWNMKK